MMLQARGNYFDSIAEYRVMVKDCENSAKYHQIVAERDLETSQELADKFKSMVVN